MRIVSKNPVIVAGLAGVLAFGVAGCSVSSESSSTTTVESTVTDEDGNTTTTTETTTVTSGGNTEDTASTEEGSGKYYANQYYGVAFILPEGFDSSEMQSEVEGEDIDYYASNADGSEAKFVLTKGVGQIEGITDEESWAQAWGDSFGKALEEVGDTDIDVQNTTVTIGELSAAALHVESTSKEGQPVYRDVYFILDEDGDGLRIILTALDEATLQSMRDGFRSTTA